MIFHILISLNVVEKGLQQLNKFIIQLSSIHQMKVIMVKLLLKPNLQEFMILIKMVISY